MNLKDVFFQKWDDLLAWYWNKYTNTSSFVGRIIVYHHITDEPLNDKPSCICSVDVFKQTLEQLKGAGYSFVSLDEMMKIMGSQRKDKFIAVTFDDVPQDVYENAYPILREKQIPFALFVSNKYIGQDGYLTERQIVEFSKDPLCTIGAHTLTHPFLRHVNNSLDELKGSKNSLEGLINKKVDYLAYPYGRHSSVPTHVRKQAKNVGFKCAFSTIPALVNAKSAKCKYFLPRIVINR